jgi:hypothetical protein
MGISPHGHGVLLSTFPIWQAELELLFDYFWQGLCAQTISSDPWVNTFLRFVDGARRESSPRTLPLARAPAQQRAAS